MGKVGVGEVVGKAVQAGVCAKDRAERCRGSHGAGVRSLQVVVAPPHRRKAHGLSTGKYIVVQVGSAEHCSARRVYPGHTCQSIHMFSIGGHNAGGSVEVQVCRGTARCMCACVVEMGRNKKVVGQGGVWW